MVTTDAPQAPRIVETPRHVSLPDVHRSVPVRSSSRLLRLFSFAGPAFLVSVGYMDPGNWATDLAAGSRFGYALLWVTLASNLMAIVLQTLSARLGIALDKDLARICRERYPRPTGIALWLLAEVAIIACDVAEVIGSAIGLNLLFGFPLVVGVLITGVDVLMLLGLMRFGFRKIEAVIVTLIATIIGSFAIDIAMARPEWGPALRGLLVPSIPNGEALLIAVGILGATVMPHNLYLHSAIVQTRAYDHSPAGRRQAIRMSTIDTVVALTIAFLVNAAILVLSAAVFGRSGIAVLELQQAHALLRPALGGAAATLFAVALLSSGQSSTVTATLAGQVVMEGFTNWRLRPWVRRLVTRGIAIVPAVLLVGGSGANRTVDLLILTQVVLSMQLPFAILPLVLITGSRRAMGEFASPRWLSFLGYATCALVVVLNVLLLRQTVGDLWLAGIGVGVALFWAWSMFVYKPKAANAPIAA